MCKRNTLDERTSKYIDIISNTIILFLKKIKSTNSDLLENSRVKEYLESFTTATQSLYYFIGSKYSGRRLCNRFSNLVSNINRVFGRSILYQLGNDGTDMCGHGIFSVKSSDGIFVIMIGDGDDTTGAPKTKPAINMGYTLAGGTRRNRRSYKKKNRRTFRNRKGTK